MEPHMIKSWRIFDWAPDDPVWLEEQGIRFSVASTNIPVAVGNSVTYMRGDVGLSVETDTPEQEMLLRLKFEPGLVLMMQEIVMPDSYSECVLNGVSGKWFLKEPGAW